MRGMLKVANGPRPSENRPSLVTSPPPVLLRALNGRYTVNGREIYRNIDIELRQGEVTCLLGPSGVGKSSLLRALAGLRREARFSVTEYAGAPNPAGAVVYMDQRDALLPWLSVLDNTLIGQRMRRRKESEWRAAQNRASQLLHQVGLEDRMHDRPLTLSGGMRQRAALARTLMQERPIILMDEPFAAVDALTRLALQSLTVDLLRNCAVLIVTHDPLEALRIGHRILVMQGSPAGLTDVMTPPSAPPRDPAVAENQRAVSTLYTQLSEGRPAVTRVAPAIEP